VHRMQSGQPDLPGCTKQHDGQAAKLALRSSARVKIPSTTSPSRKGYRHEVCSQHKTEPG
jgi:hypothetical protein